MGTASGADRAEPSPVGCRSRAVRPGERGVVVTRPHRAGEVVLVFGGPLLPLEEIVDFKYCLEVADGLFLGPSGGIDDLVNHSCDPNCRVVVDDGRTTLLAVRDVARGEEVAYDYSTMMRRDPTSFECHCGSPVCRGVIVPFRRLPRVLRTEYRRRGLVPAFVLDGVRPARRRRTAS